MTAIPDALKQESADAFRAWIDLRNDPSADPDQTAFALKHLFTVSAKVAALRNRKPALNEVEQ